MRRLLACVAVLPLLVATSARAGEEIQPEILRNAIRATVYIKEERIFHYGRFPASGTGFFIHPDGYILTNNHVVADQFTEPGSGRVFTATVVELWAVVDSGSDRERMLPATIVAMDADNDLALLKVDYSPAAWIDPDALARPLIAERVWAIGFPLGDFLASERKANPDDEVNPEITVGSGLVSSLRRDRDGTLRAIQTDAPVNPGNSGGPMIDSHGKLMGVIFAKVEGAAGIGFGISPERVRSFLTRQTVTVDFDPGIVLDPPRPILVTVRPLMFDLAAARGEALFEGDDILPQRISLERDGVGMQGSIRFPDRIRDRPRPDRYTVIITLFDEAGRPAVRRRFRLDALSEGLAGLGGEGDAARVMAQRKEQKSGFDGSEMSLDQYATSQKVHAGESRRGSLSDFARSTTIKKDADGTPVIDAQTVREVGRRSLNPANYERLQEALRSLAQEYDLARGDLDDIKAAYQEAFAYGSSTQIENLRKRRDEVEARKRRVAMELRSKGVYLCEDGLWFYAGTHPEDGPCVQWGSPW